MKAAADKRKLEPNFSEKMKNLAGHKDDNSITLCIHIQI